MRTFIFAVFAGCLVISNVWAEHEVDHRYNIRGYVLDENQQGIRGRTLRVITLCISICTMQTTAELLSFAPVHTKLSCV